MGKQEITVEFLIKASDFDAFRNGDQVQYLSARAGRELPDGMLRIVSPIYSIDFEINEGSRKDGFVRKNSGYCPV